MNAVLQSVDCSKNEQKIEDPRARTPNLRECVSTSVQAYLAAMGDHQPRNLYDFVLREVERPLLTEVSRWCGGNQSRMAEALGMSRTTLRKKLKQLGLD